MTEEADMRGKMNEKLVLALDVSTQPEMDRLLELLWGGDVACIKIGPHTEAINYILDVSSPVNEIHIDETSFEGEPNTDEFPIPKPARMIHERRERQNIIAIIKEKYHYPLVMWDMKYHGTPDVIALQVSRAVALGADFITVSGTCGPSGIAAAAKRKGNAKIIITTVLPTFDENECKRVYGVGIRETAQKLAATGLAHGADGVMCSMQELSFLGVNVHYSRLLKFVTEVRLPGATLDDRKRICTPREALHHGADYLVLDTPLLKTNQPLHALKEVIQNMEQLNGESVQGLH